MTATPGQADLVHELARQVRAAWDREFTGAPATEVDYRMSVTAAETMLAARQQQPAQDVIPPWDQASPADREAFLARGIAAPQLAAVTAQLRETAARNTALRETLRKVKAALQDPTATIARREALEAVNALGPGEL